jgi:hypothetical protein
VNGVDQLDTIREADAVSKGARCRLIQSSGRIRSSKAISPIENEGKAEVKHPMKWKGHVLLLVLLLVCLFDVAGYDAQVKPHPFE